MAFWQENFAFIKVSIKGTISLWSPEKYTSILLKVGVMVLFERTRSFRVATFFPTPFLQTLH
jgi:hypothetical protein